MVLMKSPSLCSGALSAKSLLVFPLLQPVADCALATDSRTSAGEDDIFLVDHVTICANALARGTVFFGVFPLFERPQVARVHAVDTATHMVNVLGWKEAGVNEPAVTSSMRTFRSHVGGIGVIQAIATMRLAADPRPALARRFRADQPKKRPKTKAINRQQRGASSQVRL